ncbi:DNA-processing protein DprA [Marinomonas sp. IMCC 4694]|uniref:DNA-processing protein DprA n=1 Tax=Marinomonas sp. IMCC 4694 TaxID=2605432 RepID=UPI0011E6D3BC|nr:DNA-processing protein DprA [Marinomonas sp. IMCC 4694]TYL46488.1 DNA-protecting protein DprA [Marinomonas sp. IMCC 4694]
MNIPYSGGLTKTDWLCLSFLSDIGPSRLSRLYTYLMQLEHGSEVGPMDTLSLFDAPERDGSQSLIVPPVLSSSDSISFELLKALKWPDVTARQAMAYLTKGTLTKEQATKRDNTLTWLAQDRHFLMLQEDDDYPAALKEINVAPAFLYVEGHPKALAAPKIGIVGARKCTAYGRETTFHLAEQLSSRGVCVVSGGAIGIDTAAHQGALHSKITPTLAVMGTGLLHRYPAQNRALFDRILEQGALISEYPLSTSPRPHLFPPRNRIISGLSMGVLVAEASIKSGSLISASYAVQQNRDVFALPGRLTDAQSAGCHQLLRQGAVLVRHVEDVLEQYSQLTQTRASASRDSASKSDQRVSQHSPISPPILGSTFVPLTASRHSLPSEATDNAKAMVAVLEKEAQALDFDALIRHTRWQAGTMMQVLMELELYGCIENREGLYSRC